MNQKNHKLNSKITNICFVTTYPPRECGIATYTLELKEAMETQSKNIKSKIVAIKFNETENYATNVDFVINKDKKDDYIKAAKYVNDSNIDVVNIQHEFGIFGGFNGKNILYFVERVKKPLIVTMHSVPVAHKNIKYSSSRYKSKILLMRKILKYVDGVIIMSESVKHVIRNDLQFIGRIMVLNHGAKTFNKAELNELKSHKKDLNFNKDDLIISTFGLISPRKGLQYVISALPAIIKKNPNVKIKYLIAGRMHPTESKEYLNNLKKLAKHLHMDNNVIFDSNYLPYEKIYQYLASTDIFIAPYYKGLANLTSSGTLTYALALGCCIVSTPFIYAKEILSKYAIGELINFADHKSITKTIDHLIKNPELIEKYKKNSYKLSSEFSWKNVSKEYLNFVKKII